ncbi:MAG: PorV/PorQ family protein [Candidatus Edwardsbacteria bacterium]|jgi:hypothetical protein|nr:PorV/PorQ family protein [Candidatus Edwardsbacteria bacterium]
MRKTALLAIAIISLAALWQGPASAISEGGAIFLLIRPGARACGMGSAFAAVADDASATYFNPAGLAFLNGGSPQLTEGDVRNWQQLLDSFREGDSTGLLSTGDLARPGDLVLLLAASPLVIRSDVSDWGALLAALRDSAAPAGRALRAALPADQVAATDRIDPAQGPTDDEKDQLIAALNALVTRAGLYRQPDFPGVALAPPATDALKRTIADTLSAANIADAAALWERLRTGADPLSRFIAGQLPATLRARGARLRPGGTPDPGFGAALAAGLNRVIRIKDLYRPQRVQGLGISAATAALGSRRLEGDDLVRFNRALLLEVYAPALGLAFDSAKLSDADTRIVNRFLLQAVLGAALRDFRDRPMPATFGEYLRTKLSAELDHAAAGSDGTQPLAMADVQALADGLNRLLASTEFYVDERFAAVSFSEDTRALIAERLATASPIRLNRVVLEESFPGMVRPIAEQRSAPQHIRVLLDPVSQDILAQYLQGKTITAKVRRRLIDDLNAVLARRDFYKVEVFARFRLAPDGQELANAGVDGLSQDQVMRLNRRLLEAVYPAALVPMKTDTRYATLMHSPWLSEIWKDVGDMYYEYIGYAQPVKDWGVFGGNVIFLSEGQNWHTGPNGEDLGVFSSFEFSPCLSYGNKIYEDLAGGINLKLIHSHLAPFGAEGSQGKGIATTWAIDLGAMYKGPIKGLSIGFNVQNLGPKLVYISAEQADPLSRNLRGGVAYRILDGKYSRLTAAFDLTKTIVVLNRPWRQELEEAVQHWGMEYWYLGPANLAMRSGYVYDFVGKIIGPTFGFGVGYKFLEFDFSMEPGGDLQKYNRKFSLSANF